MGVLYGFAPWIVYWVLVGNVPFAVAASVALVIAILVSVLGGLTKAPGRILQIGAVATFAVLTVLAFSTDRAFLERWAQPLSNAGMLVVALTGMLIGRPFVREFAEVGQPPEVIQSDLFARITTRLDWIWIAVFGGMTLSSAIPAIARGGRATILDTETPLSFVFYWVIPFALLGLGALASRILPDRMVFSPEVVRKTTFVAYSEATIDELYYLAREHADREVGGGREAYDVKVGGAGVPLVGDESRLSWPSTYKVRERT